MKTCPRCRREYSDETLNFCLDDGEWLQKVSGPQEPATAILQSEAPTRVQNTRTSPDGDSPKALGNVASNRNRIIAGVFGLLFVTALGIGSYRLFGNREQHEIRSIAVLPFENRSGDPDSEYLSDGLADSLIYRLSQLPRLKVSPTSSVMRYKGGQLEIAQIAQELNVDAVMSGRLLQRGDELSISVQLIDARSQKLIWAEQYERKMSDLLATQREIATVITQKLQLKLSSDEKGISKKYTSNNEAYQLYLKARYHYAKRSKEDFDEAIESFQQAVDLDPDFALAYAMIADMYTSMPAYPYMSPGETFPKASAAAQRALEIDNTLPEAFTAMGYSQCFGNRNWKGAEDALRRAIELDPRNTLAHMRYSTYLRTVGRTDEAIKEMETAVQFEPLNLAYGANLTWMYMDGGRIEDALANATRMHELEPGFMLGTYQLGLAYNAARKFGDAVALSEQALRLDPENQLMLQVLGYAYARSGRTDDARSVIARYREIAKARYVMTYFIATIYAGLGEKDAAISELEKAFDERDWRMTAHIKKDFMVDTIRDDPRFKALQRKMNFPE